MRTYIVIAAIILLTAFALGGASGCFSNNKSATGETVAKKNYLMQVDSIMNSLSRLDSLVLSHQPVARLQQAFINSRLIYKQAEAVTEYYFQGLTRRINGPALPDIKTEDGQVWPPHGFQVIEQFLYSNYHDSLADVLSNEIHLLQTDLAFVKTSFSNNTILPRHAAELVQHQLIRISALGITGFDAPLSFASLPEAAAAIKGISDFCGQYYGRSAITSTIKRQIDSAIAALKNQEFATFNRLSFLTDQLSPLSRSLNTLYSQKDTMEVLLKKPFNGIMAQWLEGKSWNPDFYTPYAVASADSQKRELGRLLFADTRLSASGTMSCATCHQPNRAFADGRDKAMDRVHGGSLLRNTPTLYYAGQQASQFYDMRSGSLEEQIHDVMKSGNEFALSGHEIDKRLQHVPAYHDAFKKIYGDADDKTGFRVRNAIAAYIRSLSPFNSRFDAYVRGQKQAMQEAERAGFNLFMGKAKCGTCHFAPLFNGTVPPFYTKAESEIIGIPAKAVWKHAAIDTDLGRYRISNIPELMYAFKTPTVRNVGKTAPYMHNGVYKNLEDVVEFYSKGGGVGIGIDLPSQTLPFDSLSLSPTEKKQLVLFLNTLTDQ